MAAAQYARPWRHIADDLRAKIVAGRWLPGDRLPTLEQLARQYGKAKGTIRNAVDQLRSEGLISSHGLYVTQIAQEARMTANTPEPQPVVAAIVTSHLGVLGGRRHDNRPPWTFIAGEIEPGESQTDAAVREVKEETGLRVRAGRQEIGRRVHPITGRTMIYLACTPTEGTDVFVGDTDELAEVRWADLAFIGKVMGQANVYEPVWDHLSHVLA
jgi:8-oxo-dGTP pyrophosphatase MutT (NUDIX family)